MQILITGGTGFLGCALTKLLVTQGHQVSVLSRQPEKVAKICGPTVHALASLQQLTPDSQYQAMINLAGAPIFAARWSDKRKHIIRSSRIDLTHQLVAKISQMTTKPEVLISGSAIGYYGDQGDTPLTETSTPHPDFSQQLCRDWELAAQAAEQYGVRVCLIRTGLVLAPDGGILQRMLLPFRLGLGGRLGNGQQWMSWIHRQDWLSIVSAMLDNSTMQGPYNATAPNPVSNQAFTSALAQSLHRPALLPTPAWLLKMALGEMAELVLGSQRVLPERLLAQGFNFEFKQLEDALKLTI